MVFSVAANGCVGLISSGESGQESAFMDAGLSGDDVFFITASRLVPGAPADGSYQLYDAHVCPAGAPCVQPAVAADCRLGSCEGAAASQSLSEPASEAFSGPGNPAPAPPAVKGPTTAQLRAQQLTRALKGCRAKHNRRNRTACERQARKRYGPAKARKAGHASTTQKGGK